MLFSYYSIITCSCHLNLHQDLIVVAGGGMSVRNLNLLFIRLIIHNLVLEFRGDVELLFGLCWRLVFCLFLGR